MKRPKTEPATVEVVNEMESTSEPSQDDEDFNPEYFNSEQKQRIKKTAWFCRFEDCPRGDGGRPFTKRKNRNVHEEWYFDLLYNYLNISNHRKFKIPKQTDVHKKIRNHICTECGRAFSGGGQLRRHMFIHTRVSNHKCPFCGKMFHAHHRLLEHEVNRT